MGYPGNLLTFLIESLFSAVGKCDTESTVSFFFSIFLNWQRIRTDKAIIIVPIRNVTGKLFTSWGVSLITALAKKCKEMMKRSAFVTYKCYMLPPTYANEIIFTWIILVISETKDSQSSSPFFAFNFTDIKSRALHF